MTHASPAVYLVWTLTTGTLNVFLLHHLWSFDRFECLNWNSKSHAGTFKRFMTYTYVITVPLIFTYSLGNLIIKYGEGFVDVPFYGIIPKPWQLWRPANQATIFPFTLLFAIGWSFEMVTHLEELCFWFFIVNASSVQHNWFQSPYFKFWLIGSVVALSYLPFVTILTRGDPTQNEAFTFLAGSIGSLSLTVWFMPILFTFPSFMKELRCAKGVDVSTIVRLTKFSELNTIRVAMRFLFSVPLLILGIDGVRAEHHVNENMLYTDLLGIIAAFGVAISSGITLVIFFPRCIEGEIALRDAAKEKHHTNHTASHAGIHFQRQSISFFGGRNEMYGLASIPGVHNYNFDLELQEVPCDSGHPSQWQGRVLPANLPSVTEIGRVELTEADIPVHNTKVNPMITNFTSPIDLIYAPPDERRWLTFLPRV